MSERNLNFEQGVDRKGTRCLKYDFAVQRGRSADILPLWVADMDFKTSSYIQDALLRQAEHGVYGYTEADETYFDAVRSWMERRHGWKIEPEWLLKTPGVVFALAMAVKAYTEPGDYVLIQEPVYYPFREVIESNDREVANNVLYQDENGSYKIDFEDFERQIVEKRIRLFLLCSPHNPVSRVWTREELEKLGDICKKHGVIVVSDEIHADFVFDGKHQVFADLKPEYKDFTVICTSPGKTFNIAGLQASNILVWMDFRGLGIAEENLKDFVENRAGLWLDGGKMFGESGSGFQRINVACPRKTLEKALTQLETAVKNL